MRLIVILLLALCAFPEAATAAWSRAESDHFVLYSQGGPTALREEAEKLERFDQLMRILTGIPRDGVSPVKLTVYFVRTTSDVKALYRGKQKTVGAFYVPSVAGAFAVVPREIGGSAQVERYADLEDVVLFHEYAHHLMLQYFVSAYPAWYIEGFAEFVSNSKLEKDGSIKLGLPNLGRGRELLFGTKLPIATLLTARLGELKRDQVGALYARAWLLTHYLNIEPSRSGQLASYLKAIGEGQPGLAAAQSVFGDLAVLDKALDRYLAARNMTYRTISNLPPRTGRIDARLLGPAEGDAVLPSMRLTQRSSAAEREPIAVELRKLSARYPRDPAVLTLLAEAELDVRNYAASIAAADAAISISPTNARALLWKGMALARPLAAAKDRDPAKWRTARSWIVKANRASPDDPLPLIEYFRSFTDAGQQPTDIAVEGLGKAVMLVPQYRQGRMNYAVALAFQKKYGAARTVIAPIISDPHSGVAALAAQRMVAAIEAAAAGGIFKPPSRTTTDAVQP